jgi:hypothetical protein
MVVHAAADNYANIPTRYHSHNLNVFDPDPTTVSAGDSGDRIAWEDQPILRLPRFVSVNEGFCSGPGQRIERWPGPLGDASDLAGPGDCAPGLFMPVHSRMVTGVPRGSVSARWVMTWLAMRIQPLDTCWPRSPTSVVPCRAI